MSLLRRRAFSAWARGRMVFEKVAVEGVMVLRMVAWVVWTWAIMRAVEWRMEGAVVGKEGGGCGGDWGARGGMGGGVNIGVVEMASTGGGVSNSGTDLERRMS
jgi:hypothetical protein